MNSKRESMVTSAGNTQRSEISKLNIKIVSLESDIANQSNELKASRKDKNRLQQEVQEL
jgi:outer membrane murein-binding lipoprotein Lpp